MDDIWSGITQLDPNAMTHSFDEIIKAVQTKVNALDREFKSAQEKFNNL